MLNHVCVPIGRRRVAQPLLNGWQLANQDSCTFLPKIFYMLQQRVEQTQALYEVGLTLVSVTPKFCTFLSPFSFTSSHASQHLTLNIVPMGINIPLMCKAFKPLRMAFEVKPSTC